MNIKSTHPARNNNPLVSKILPRQQLPVSKIVDARILARK
jgi:hypothetical protein